MTSPFNQPAALRVLITGAAGNIGRVLRAQLMGRYALLRLTDVAPQEAAGPGEAVSSCLPSLRGQFGSRLKHACHPHGL